MADYIRCPWCGALIPVREDGRFFWHTIPSDQVCPASLKEPGEVPVRYG